MAPSQVEKSIIRRLWAWFQIAKPIWLTLFFGFAWFLTEFFLWLAGVRAGVAAGGAMMVGAAVVAQTQYSRLPVREALSGAGPENIKHQAMFNTPYATAISAKASEGQNLLYRLARASDFVPKRDTDESHLVLESVLYRVDKYLEIAIAISAALGTVVWAYAGELITL